MTTEVDIYNRACDAIGSRANIASPTEVSREAQVCRRWYGPVRDQVLRSAYWGSAKAYARLSVLAERNANLPWEPQDPEPGTRFAYAVPNDILAPRYLTSYEQFTYGIHGPNRALFTNVEDAVLTYTRRQEAINTWDTQLEMAIVNALAAYICRPLTGKRNLAGDLASQANGLILQAQQADANSDNFQIDTVPDWIAARGFALSTYNTSYYFPYGPMIDLASLPGAS